MGKNKKNEKVNITEGVIVSIIFCVIFIVIGISIDNLTGSSNWTTVSIITSIIVMLFLMLAFIGLNENKKKQKINDEHNAEQTEPLVEVAHDGEQQAAPLVENKKPAYSNSSKHSSQRRTLSQLYAELNQLNQELEIAEKRLKSAQNYYRTCLRANECTEFAQENCDRELKVVDAIKKELEYKNRIKFVIDSISSLCKIKKCSTILKAFQNNKGKDFLSLKLDTTTVKNINKIEKINSPLELNEIEFDGFSIFTENNVIDKYIEKYKDEYKISILRNLSDKYSSLYVQNKTYIKKGQKICEIPYTVYYKQIGTDLTLNFSSVITINAPKDGYIEIYKYQLLPDKFLRGELTLRDAFNKQKKVVLFSMYQDRSKWLNEICHNEINVKTDDFTKEKHLTIEEIGTHKTNIRAVLSPNNYNHPDNYTEFYKSNLIFLDKYSFGFTLENINGRDYMPIVYYNNEYRINEGDKIMFLFSNEEIIEFTFNGKPKKNDKQKRKYYIPLYIEDIEVLKNNEVEKARIELRQENSKKTFDFNIDLKFITKKLFIDYHNAVIKEFLDYKPLSKKEISKDDTIKPDENCHVYLMVDTVNNYHKIGISNKPVFRESTLQSEKPTIELICSKKFPNRIIAQSIEKALHDAFKDKRIRGEWFSLDEKDIENISDTLAK